MKLEFDWDELSAVLVGVIIVVMIVVGRGCVRDTSDDQKALAVATNTIYLLQHSK